MGKIIAALIRCVLVFNVLSFLSDKLAPFTKNGGIEFPSDTDARTKVAVLVLVTFGVFLYGIVWSIRLFFRIIGYVFSMVFRTSKK